MAGLGRPARYALGRVDGNAVLVGWVGQAGPLGLGGQDGSVGWVGQAGGRGWMAARGRLGGRGGPGSEGLAALGAAGCGEGRTAGGRCELGELGEAGIGEARLAVRARYGRRDWSGESGVGAWRLRQGRWVRQGVIGVQGKAVKAATGGKAVQA